MREVAASRGQGRGCSLKKTLVRVSEKKDKFRLFSWIDKFAVLYPVELDCGLITNEPEGFFKNYRWDTWQQSPVVFKKSRCDSGCIIIITMSAV